MSAGSFTDEVFRAWRASYIFFYLVQYGWGKTVKTKANSYVAKNSPVSQMARLGLPTRGELWRANALVRRTAPVAAVAYKAAWREFSEALERYRATRSKLAWDLYRGAGQGYWNRQAVAYQSHIAKRRRGAMSNYRRRHRYLFEELLPRSQERQRARQEMSDADHKLAELKQEIFQAMGVPLAYRRLSL